MADIVSVREFTKNLKKYRAGESVVVVDAARKEIVANIEFKQPPESIEKVIRHVFTWKNIPF